ncbi:MAG: hypothetical protein ACOY3I_09130 [Verrucomicrobiota bacterium]
MILSEKIIQEHFGDFKKEKSFWGNSYYRLKNGDVIVIHSHRAGCLYQHSQASTQYFFKYSGDPHSFDRVEYVSPIFKISVNEKDNLHLSSCTDEQRVMMRIGSKKVARIKKECGCSSDVKSVSPFPKRISDPMMSSGEMYSSLQSKDQASK